MKKLGAAKYKLIILIAIVVFVSSAGFISYKFWDFKENNPKFCVTCHLMTPAYTAWASSVHAGISCHKCHHLSLMDQNKLLISFIFKNPSSVPPRHGKTIVPWKFCADCHWEKSSEYPNAPKITGSQMHAIHAFKEGIECTACHGYIVHRFTPEPRFCVKCHQGKEVHGVGMEGLACLNCHTDRTSNLLPDRSKCLYCHGSEQVRKDLIAEGSIDGLHYQPLPATVKKAIKIKAPEDAPMQFYCYNCHRPHAQNIMPSKDHCLKCHPEILHTGKHPIHVGMMKLSCTECHRPHIWRVTKEIARTECVKCHAYKDPKEFLQ